MRILFKLAVKFAFLAILVIVLSGGVRYALQKVTKTPGTPGSVPGAVPVSSEESGLISTVFGSALRLLSGSASRDELAGDLSKKLYGERAESAEMSELGIELVKPNGEVLDLKEGAGKPNPKPVTSVPDPQLARTTESTAQPSASNGPSDRLTLFWERAKVCSVELTVIPVVFLGMVIWTRKRRRSLASDFVPGAILVPGASDAEPYDMKHPVHSLAAEEFELLVALIYQRQGYRISMPAGLSGGRGGDFTLLRKGERVLVQCKKLNVDHKLPVERVRELHDAMLTAGASRGMFVASCGFTWDARNFAKTKGITVINARTLDELIIAARANPSEDLLAVASWLPALMMRVDFTTPTCPACEASMDEVDTSHNSVWVCRHRPECRGRRPGRKYRKPNPPVAPQRPKVGCEAA